MSIKKLILLFAFLSCCTTLLQAQQESAMIQAQQYFFSGDYQNAIKLYEQLYQNQQYQAFIFDNYFNSLLKINNVDEATKLVKKRIKEEGNTPGLLLYLGLIQQHKGNTAEADKIYADVIKNLPADVFTISTIASNFYNINNIEMATKTFLAGRKLLGNDTQFSIELINIYRYTKDKNNLSAEILNIIETTPEYLQIAKSNLQRTFDSTEDYQTFKSILLKRVQKVPQNIALSDLLAWTFTQLKEYDLALIQTIAIDKRTQDNGAKVFALSNILADNEAYEAAIKGYNYVVEKGSQNSYYSPAKLALLNLQKEKLLNSQHSPSLAELKELANSYEDILEMLGKNARSINALVELARLKAYYLNQTQEAELLLELALDTKGLNPEDLAELKIELADIYTLNQNFWDASLLLGQVEKAFPNHPLGQEAKFKNAKISFYKGDFKWAKSQLDVLKASTSQLIANDALDLSLLIQDNTFEDTSGNALKVYARAEFLRFQNLNNQALSLLDSLTKAYPTHALDDDIWVSKARIFSSMKQFEQAAKAYETIIEKHSQSIWADDALFNLALLYQDKLNNTPKAKQCYEQLLEKFPGSLYVVEANKKYRLLKEAI
ncbi:tetratricopeptide repeat protein [Pedobacter glucosidilyticus]|uniref:tetratricopeptide repeat protein n=1 Tax=Pedobacter glucosidilyticus TaxID=1122941 RepID=UPI00041A93BE|nr:tetratricopeptide repeat protein [Pedobacter glucosidilyticus]